jgi:cell division protein FtsB
MRNIRRQQVKQKKKIRGVIILSLGILFFIYLSLSLVFGENGLLRYMHLLKETKDLRAEINTIQTHDDDMERHIDSLENDPELIEKLARDQGFIKEGELIFKFEEERSGR